MNEETTTDQNETSCGQVGFDRCSDMVVFKDVIINKHHVHYLHRADSGNAIIVLHDGKGIGTGNTFEEAQRIFL
jgi:hypothetical protein